MTGNDSLTNETPLPGSQLAADRMPGHWLLARLGKRVLRPGGVELTERLLHQLDITPDDDVVELAPGLGATTRLVLDRSPASYRGVDRDADAVTRVDALLDRPQDAAVRGSATSTGLDDASADVLFGEAYLTMQPASQKELIVAEAARVVRPGGRLGLHEISFAPDDISGSDAERIADELGRQIKVNVSPLSLTQWTELLGRHGFEVDTTLTAPMHLLEPRRFLADEGPARTVRFVVNLARDRDARRRVLGMRRAMRANSANLQACAIVARRTVDAEGDR